MLPTTSDYFDATKSAEVIRHVLVDELKLEAPAQFGMVEDGQFHWMIAVMDKRNLRHPIARYTHEGVRHQLSTALDGLPVALSNSSGLRFGVLLSGRPQLPKSLTFPGMPGERDVIRFGVGLRGEVSLHAKKIINMIVCGGQDSGKSTLLRMMAYTARFHGAKLYLADSQEHTFNPDAWNPLAAMPVAGSRSALMTLLARMQAEAEERSVLFRQAAQGGVPPDDIDAYNVWADTQGADTQVRTLPRVWLIGDEMNSYLSDRAVQERIVELARTGRKWGVHLVLAGHNWRSEDIPRGLSAMFPTRLCLQVADDTSGRVTLDDQRWGRQAMKFKTPGRAVLRLRTYQTIQVYKITPEQEREWLSGTQTLPPLNEVEQKIVEYAVRQGGEFKFREIAASVEGTSEWQVRKLAETWTERGWLEYGKDATSPRRVTQKLADLAGTPLPSASPHLEPAETRGAGERKMGGETLTGAQASQGITGGSQAASEPLTGTAQALTGLTGA